MKCVVMMVINDFYNTHNAFALLKLVILSHVLGGSGSLEIYCIDEKLCYCC